MSDIGGTDGWYDGEEKPEVERAADNFGKFFALRGETILQVTDPKDIKEAFKIENRRIAFNDFENETYVSTVFLCIDHNFGDSDTPILFETLAVLDGHEFEMRRYPTVESALTGHREVLESLEAAIKNDK